MVALVPHLTRLMAGIPIPNTHLINSSIALARANLPEHTYNHVMRSWLNGQAIINHLPAANRSKIDVEAYGVAAILHDMGFAWNASFVSADKIFEVDGANAARALIRQQGGKEWTEARIQLVWDAIALHGFTEVARYKETEVLLTCAGTFTELVGPEVSKASFGDLITVNETEYAAIEAAFPSHKLLTTIREDLVELCRIKPATTYTTFVGDWGEKYLPGYTRVGHRSVDLLEAIVRDYP
ncbi:hypothetical protein DM02DRAFT_708676 [Periconia macrospinosa]|uniref:HD domain-containing protein n=1 Tax=Periconia macrospinosa TaxID=97972 RepID=A0A2V1D0T1_9PLEO|nr:hypothetical protein DM02DRAFT_708676 [Periconia macrospinosa]